MHKLGTKLMYPGSLLADPVTAISLGLGLMFGTAGLPHILMRFFTVTDAKEARKSVLYASGFVAYFFNVIFIMGLCGRPAVPNIRPRPNEIAVTGSASKLPGYISLGPSLCNEAAFSTKVAKEKLN